MIRPMFCRIVISIFLFIFMSGHCFAQNIDNEVAEDRLIVGDTISVVIKNVPEMSGEYTVDDMGRVDLPYIGKVKASGQAPLTLAKILEDLYKDDYLVDPSIDVLIFAKALPEKEIVSFVKPYNTPQLIINQVTTSEPDISEDDLLSESAPTPLQTPILDEEWDNLTASQWSYEGEEHSLFVQFLSESKMTGSAGCGSFFAQYNTTVVNMNIDQITSTFLHCKNNKQTQATLDLLKSTKNYLVIGDELKLIDAGENIIFSLNRTDY